MHVTVTVLAGATLLLAGIGWVVQAVVYPAFALVPDAAWPGYHAAHSRRITLVVGPPWVVQGVTTVVLLLREPLHPVTVACAVTALGGVVLTLGAVREHGLLDDGPDAVVLRRLLRWNLARTVAWTVGGAVALVGAAAG